MVHFDIIMPCFNNEWRVVRQAFDSVIRQTHTDWTLWVCEGKPPFRLYPPIEELIKTEYSDYPIHHVWQTGEGISQGRNQASAEGDGEYISFLDGDDYWLDTKLEKMNTRIQNRDTALVWDLGISFLDHPKAQNGEIENHIMGFHKEWGKTRNQDKWLRATFHPITTSLLTVRRAEFEAINGFNEKVHYAEDMDFMVRMMRTFPSACHQFGIPLTKYRGSHLNRIGQKNIHCKVEKGKIQSLPSLQVVSEIDHDRAHNIEGVDYLNEAYRRYHALKESSDPYDKWLFDQLQTYQDIKEVKEETMFLTQNEVPSARTEWI